MKSGDANHPEVIHIECALNEAQAKYQWKNHFFESASIELTKAEDEIAQNEQVLKQLNEQVIDSVFLAPVDGIVINVSVTTVAGVLRAGEEMMHGKLATPAQLFLGSALPAYRRTRSSRLRLSTRCD